jgi:hypothetical protein
MLMHENGKMRSVETIPGMGQERGRGGGGEEEQNKRE